jgi:hypothetical protein
MRIFTSKRRIAVIGAVTAVALAGGGAAYAYFTSGGSGSGSGLVGSASSLTVSVTGPTGGPLFPGSGLATDTADGIQTFSYTVTNPGPGSQSYNTVTITAAPSSSAAAAGCLQTWYDVNSQTPSGTSYKDVITLGAPVDLASSGTSTPATFTLQLIDEDTSQNTCEGDTPSVTVAVSTAP